MGLELIFGIGFVGLLLAYLFFKSNDDKGVGGHFLLRLMLLGCLFGVFVLLGKASLDSSESCELVMTGQFDDNTHPNNTIKTFSYDVVCYSKTEANTGLTFYRLTLWIVRLISAYFLIYFFYELFLWLSKIIRGRRGRSR
jgi:hypothetical protein